MALLTMFINKPTKTSVQRTVSNAPAPIEMDAQISESFKAEADATEHPIEGGADITDHVIIKPNQLNIVGMISETPMNLGASLQGAATTVGSAIGSTLAKKMGVNVVSSVSGLGGAIGAGLAGKTLSTMLGLTPTNRLAGVITELIATRDSKDPVTIQTGLQKYDNYVLTSVQIDRDQSSGRSIKVSLTFKQLIKVSSLTAKVNVPKITSAVPKKNLGNQASNAANGSQTKGASLLFQGANGIKKVFGY